MRELHTADEIRDEVARLLNTGRKKALPVPLPVKLAMESADIDEYFANWAMYEQGGWETHRDEVKRAILAVKAKWDMR